MTDDVEDGGTLPPNINKNNRSYATLRLSIQSLNVSSSRKLNPVVHVTWWGQKTPTVFDRLYSSSCRSKTYRILTSKDRFKTYLNDSRKLRIEVYDVDDIDGFRCHGSVSNIERFADCREIKETVPLFDSKNDRIRIGDIRISTFYDEECIRNDISTLNSSILIHVHSILFDSKFLSVLYVDRHRKSALPSFFVSVNVPKKPSSTFCSRKQTKYPPTMKRGEQQIYFDAKTIYEFETDSTTEDNVRFQISYRFLDQRTPILLGEARIKLKRCESVRERLQLPIFASQNVINSISSEIIGDLWVSFRNHSTMRPSVENETVTLRSKVTRIPCYYDNEDHEETERSIFCRLYVERGRNFGVNHRDLSLSCRFLSAHDVVSTGICRNTTSPIWCLRSLLPFQINSDFLQRTKENHLVVEVWNHKSSDEKDLVGVCLLPLHQFYLVYKDPKRRKVILQSSQPVIAVDDWVPVRDLVHSCEMGELKASLMAGTEDQLSIHRNDNNNEEEEEERTEDTSQYDPVVSSSCSVSEMSTSVSTFDVEVIEGRNLPTLRDRSSKYPNTYVSFLNKVSDVCSESTNPKWNFKTSQVILESNQYLIIRVWHSDSCRDRDHDEALGFAALDLSPIKTGVPELLGWFNVMDFMGKVKGQIKVRITPTKPAATTTTTTTTNESIVVDFEELKDNIQKRLTLLEKKNSDLEKVLKLDLGTFDKELPDLGNDINWNVVLDAS